MYQRRLNEIQKAVQKGKIEVNTKETAFIMRMNQTLKKDITAFDKKEIDRLWCKV